VRGRGDRERRRGDRERGRGDSKRGRGAQREGDREREREPLIASDDDDVCFMLSHQDN
jgi:hypothetical protein